MGPRPPRTGEDFGDTDLQDTRKQEGPRKPFLQRVTSGGVVAGQGWKDLAWLLLAFPAGCSQGEFLQVGKYNGLLWKMTS